MWSWFLVLFSLLVTAEPPPELLAPLHRSAPLSFEPAANEEHVVISWDEHCTAGSSAMGALVSSVEAAAGVKKDRGKMFRQHGGQSMLLDAAMEGLIGALAPDDKGHSVNTLNQFVKALKTTNVTAAEDAIRKRRRLTQRSLLRNTMDGAQRDRVITKQNAFPVDRRDEGVLALHTFVKVGRSVGMLKTGSIQTSYLPNLFMDAVSLPGFTTVARREMTRMISHLPCVKTSEANIKRFPLRMPPTGPLPVPPQHPTTAATGSSTEDNVKMKGQMAGNAVSTSTTTLSPEEDTTKFAPNSTNSTPLREMSTITTTSTASLSPQSATTTQFRPTGAAIRRKDLSKADINVKLDTVAHWTPSDWTNYVTNLSDPMAPYQWFMGGEPWGGNIAGAWKLAENHSQKPPMMKVAVVDSECAEALSFEIRFWENASECNGTPGVDDDGDGYIDNCHGYDLGENRGALDGISLHGTPVSGLIAAIPNNSVGIAGVCPLCEVVCLKVTNAQGDIYVSSTLRAYDYLLQNVNTIRISNHSYGGLGYIGAEEEALQKLSRENHMMVVAAGNESCDFDTYYGVDPGAECHKGQVMAPAQYNVETLISVGASTEDGQVPTWSNRGTSLVDMWAPGTDISTFISRETTAVGFWSGTSFSSPIVMGSIAFVWAHFPEMAAKPMMQMFLESTRSFPAGSLIGKHGLLDTAAVMEKMVSAPPHPEAAPEALYRGASNDASRSFNGLWMALLLITVRWFL